MLQSPQMGKIDRERSLSFGERKYVAKMAIDTAVKNKFHPDLNIAWTGGGTSLDGKEILAFYYPTKNSIVTGTSIALAAVDLNELKTQAHLYAEQVKPDADRVKEPARKALIDSSQNKLLALTGSPTVVNQIDELLNEFLPPEELLLRRKEIGVAVAKHTLLCSDVATADLRQRLPFVGSFTALAIDAVHKLGNKKRPSWLPRHTPSTDRPTTSSSTPTTQPTEAEPARPSLRRLPGGRSGPGGNLPF